MEPAETGSDAPTIYERDFQLWRFEQAELLQLRRFSQADLPNIVEELESMGRSLKSSLRSSYRPVIAHLLKYQPEMRSASWGISLCRERSRIDEIGADNPSLKAEAPSLAEGAYKKARKEAQVETRLPLSTFPAEGPYALDHSAMTTGFPPDGAIITPSTLDARRLPR